MNAVLSRAKRFVASTCVLVGVALLVHCATPKPMGIDPGETTIDAKTQTFRIPDTPYRKEVEIFEHVVLVPAATMEQASRVEADELTFARGVEPIESLGAGDIITSRFEGGLFKKVLQVDRSDAGLTLSVADARLNEAVASGSFYFGPTREISFSDGHSYTPPEGFDEGAVRRRMADDDELVSGLAEEWVVAGDEPADALHDVASTLYQIGAKAPDAPGLVAQTANLTAFLNNELARMGLRPRLEVAHQYLDAEFAAAAALDICRGAECPGDEASEVLPQIARFEATSHGGIDATTKLRYAGSALVLPDANANGQPDWQEPELADWAEIAVVSSRPDDDPVFDAQPLEPSARVDRQFELIPGVTATVHQRLVMRLQVDSRRAAKVTTGMRVKGSSSFGYTTEKPATPHPIDQPDAFRGTILGPQWHARPSLEQSEEVGDELHIRVQLEPQVEVEFGGGVEAGASVAAPVGEHAFEQHVSAPQAGNCAATSTVDVFGRAKADLAGLMLGGDQIGDQNGDQGGASADNAQAEPRIVRRTLDARHGQLALPEVCNPAWTPVADFQSRGTAGRCVGDGELVVARRVSLRTHEEEPVDYGECRNGSSYTDADHDGLSDDNVPCVYNPAQHDSDGNGQGDASDRDSDEDGVLDLVDNCPKVYNPPPRHQLRKFRRGDREERPDQGSAQVCEPKEQRTCVEADIKVAPVKSRTYVLFDTTEPSFDALARYELAATLAAHTQIVGVGVGSDHPLRGEGGVPSASTCATFPAHTLAGAESLGPSGGRLVQWARRRAKAAGGTDPLSLPDKLSGVAGYEPLTSGDGPAHLVVIADQIPKTCDPNRSEDLRSVDGATEAAKNLHEQGIEVVVGAAGKRRVGRKLLSRFEEISLAGGAGKTTFRSRWGLDGMATGLNSCRFRLSGLPDDFEPPGFEAYLRIDNQTGTETEASDSAASFHEVDGLGTDSTITADDVVFLAQEEGSSVIELSSEVCETYRASTERWSRRGYNVSLHIPGQCLADEEPGPEPLQICGHSDEPIANDRDFDDWPDPLTPNPTQLYDPAAEGYVGRTTPTAASVYHYALEQWDRCPYHPNPAPRPDEPGAGAGVAAQNDGAPCRVKFDHAFELDFPDGVSRDDYAGAYPIVDYDGDGALAHHPGYPAPCRPQDIAECGDAADCTVPRCSDNCPTAPNPHQLDGDGDGVGDACQHADSEPVDRAEDAGGSFDIDRPHFIDSSGRLKVYDSSQDGVPDHRDNCPYAWNPDQLDADADGVGNPCDPDRDADGLGDACDGDMDGDDVVDVLDFCRRFEGPDDANSAEACRDVDQDGVTGDAAHYPPIGEETIADTWYTAGWGAFPDQQPERVEVASGTVVVPRDNCPTVFNPDQADADGDGVGDVCDPDRDGDGAPNAQDECP